MERESIKQDWNMRVMCIHQFNFKLCGFTIEPGQWLEVYDNSVDYHYYTFERNGSEWFVEKYKFITVQQFREKQLNTLLK